jgi:hypothetical protein
MLDFVFILIESDDLFEIFNPTRKSDGCKERKFTPLGLKGKF